MTCKAIILLTRRADTSHEEFAAWWLGEHAPLAKQLPGVRRAVFNLVDQPAEGDPDSGVAPGTAFSNLPSDWHCPDCGAARADFEPVAD